MQYLQKGGFQQNPLMRLTLGFTVLFLVGFVITNFMIYFSKMGLTPESVITYYNGSEETFHPARTYGSMLEVTHGHLPVMAILILMLTHLVIFSPFAKSQKIAFITLSFASAFLDEGSGWLVRFVHPQFAWLKISSFFILQASLIFLLISLALFLFHARTESNNKETLTDSSDEISDEVVEEFQKQKNCKKEVIEKK